MTAKDRYRRTGMDDDMDGMMNRKDGAGAKGATEPSYEERRTVELGGGNGRNPFAEHVQRPADEGHGDGNDGEGTDHVEPGTAGHPDDGDDRDRVMDTEARISSGETGDGGHDDDGDLETRMTTVRDQGMIQMWLVFGVSMLIAAMSPILLPFLVLSSGSRTGIIWFLVIEGFVPVITAIITIVELATRPSLRSGGAGKATMVMAILVVIVDALVILVFARFGGDVMTYYAATMKGLGNAAGSAW